MLDLSEIPSNTVTKNLGSSQAVTAVLPWCTQDTDNLETQLAKNVKINHSISAYNISGFPLFFFFSKKTPPKPNMNLSLLKSFLDTSTAKDKHLLRNACWAGSARSWTRPPSLTLTQKRVLLPHPSSTFAAANHGMPLHLVSLNISLWLAARCMRVGWRFRDCLLVMEREAFFSLHCLLCKSIAKLCTTSFTFFGARIWRRTPAVVITDKIYGTWGADEEKTGRRRTWTVFAHATYWQKCSGSGIQMPWIEAIEFFSSTIRCIPLLLHQKTST